jgi:hypothetical protein
MPNIQQPEMRRSGRDPLVQDSAEIRAGSARTPGGGGPTGPVPPDQQSPYGPQTPQERQPGGDVPAHEVDAILVGGPRDGTRFHASSAGLVTLEVDGLVERYIQTTATREVDGRQLLVYNYDGEVRPST